MGTSDQELGLPQPPLELPLESEGEVLTLPGPDCIDTDLRRVIEMRQSIRNYRETALNQEELSYLLWCTQGVKKVSQTYTRRTVPSAGSRHAFETYVLVNRVDGFAPGVYRYLATKHQLLAHAIEASMADKISAACLDQQFISHSAATFIWTAVVERMTWRYQERGYRYLYLDAGHVCQNLYLAAESVCCGACAIAAFDDDQLNTVLGLDGEKQFAIYLAAVGKR